MIENIESLAFTFQHHVVHQQDQLGSCGKPTTERIVRGPSPNSLLDMWMKIPGGSPVFFRWGDLSDEKLPSYIGIIIYQCKDPY